MSEWEAWIAAQRESFLEGLAEAGFAVKSTTLAEGDIDCDGRRVWVTIHIPDDFPYEPPKVRPVDGSGGLSWHAERDGSLCLWAATESGDLPWQSVAQVVERVQHWFREEAGGWANDTPDLDLERYWARGSGLVVVPDLDVSRPRPLQEPAPLIGGMCRVERDGPVWIVKPGSPPKKGKRHLPCLVIDVGELLVPLRTPEQIAEAVAAHGSREKERKVLRGEVAVIVVRYWRAGTSGLLALVTTSTSPLEFKAVKAVYESGATRELRAGPDHSVLNGKSIAVVGVGAIGSQVADLLSRAGAGILTLVDADVVLPGNLIRHTASASDVGRPKVDAVHDLVAHRQTTQTQEADVRTIADVTQLLDAHDLVIDATANHDLS